ncbi:MAG TPA: penicillin-binding protein 2 [Patescibacteria group bacterium]
MTEQSTQNLQRRRLMFISLVLVLLISFLGLRLAQKQLLEHPTYKTLAHEQQYQQKELVGRRGQILVKDGGTATYPLATNQIEYAVNVVPSQVTDKEETAKELGKILETEPDIILKDINNDKLYLPPLGTIDYDRSKELEKLALSGIYLTPSPTRFYPEDGLAAQVLGFVNSDGKGQYGIESYFDDILHGSVGSVGQAKNATGQELALGVASYTPPKDGDNVVLTIDRNVQFKVEEALDAMVDRFSADGGSIMVMDPKTGAIVAMASRPTFDPNRFGAFDVASYTNQAVTGTYEPGSTFKTIVMASALDAGAVTPDTPYKGTASIKVADREIFNAERRPYGDGTMTDAIERSDNVGMVQAVQRMGGRPLYDYVKRFGFGTPSGLEVAGEVTPNLPALSELTEVRLATMSFGQGISVTPVQLLTAVGSFANQGKLVQPHIVDRIQHQDGTVEVTKPKVVRQAISPRAASQITGMMIRVVEAGAGRPAAVQGYRVAGKTGTAQIASGGAYEENATIGNFVGFAPANDPKFVMLVKVDRPKGVTFAEESAAPTFGEVAKFLLQYYNAPPS